MVKPQYKRSGSAVEMLIKRHKRQHIASLLWHTFNTGTHRCLSTRTLRYECKSSCTHNHRLITAKWSLCVWSVSSIDHFIRAHTHKHTHTHTRLFVLARICKRSSLSESLSAQILCVCVWDNHLHPTLCNLVFAVKLQHPPRWNNAGC